MLRYWTKAGGRLQVARGFHRSNAVCQVKSLEDLAKLKSLDEVDPEMVKRLINERTNELNTQNELQMLKRMETEQDQRQNATLKKFVRPAWILLIMSSIVYLTGHLVWWKLEYEERELKLKRKVHELELNLNDLVTKKSGADKDHNGLNADAACRKWYWLWLR
ncbi:LAMI_0E08020g1_1 [Lachancea mirantina]|uniref:LAMI_0E08020g1_1 n=1 Tax=Lachancea mirantina TaxID=1230905 RepID=A0A1G4JMX4_9SACH|nr:LAMI_0E08020g1_1 [Lachancea mirantina]